METYAKVISRPQVLATVFLVVGLILLSENVFADGTDDDKRLSITTQNHKQQRDNGVPGIVSQDEFDPLVSVGQRSTGKRSSLQSKTLAQISQAPNIDFWFYAADVVLFNDNDGDGYYHGIDLLFDADTYFTFAEVYAVVYLSLEGGPWNEYAATEDFTIIGASSDDEFVLVTELLSGYPSGSYDILIELFDAYDDSFLAWIGPEETSELAFLPLEDADRDVAVIPEVIVVHHGGGGSVGLSLVLMLGLTALASYLRERYA
jgi:hypothetical protein